MQTVLTLLAVQGFIGAFDTVYYHEWRAKLPARGHEAAPELRLHAIRSILYAILFGTLPWLAWHGTWVIALAGILLMEIILTLWDFLVEIRVRKLLGDVYGGERVTHAVMGIIYGGMIANLVPVLVDWWMQPTALVFVPAAVTALCWVLSVMSVGVLLSGLRDLYAALGGPRGGWPWDSHFASDPISARAIASGS